MENLIAWPFSLYRKTYIIMLEQRHIKYKDGTFPCLFHSVDDVGSGKKYVIWPYQDITLWCNLTDLSFLQGFRWFFKQLNLHRNVVEFIFKSLTVISHVFFFWPFIAVFPNLGRLDGMFHACWPIFIVISLWLKS